MANHLAPGRRRSAFLITLALTLPACREHTEAKVNPAAFELQGTVTTAGLDEISGLQAGPASTWFVQNDDGQPVVHVIDLEGNHLAAVEVSGANNTDWEDLAAIPGDAGPLLVIGDTGDNLGQRKSVRLYLLPYPAPDAAGRYPTAVELLNTLTLRYPDGPRDCEAMAYDPASQQILLLSKRDNPPRLYAIKAALAVTAGEATLEFLGEVSGLRPPTPIDLLRWPERGAWISQPTGMDISANGRIATVITYRSLYLYQRKADESWSQAFRSAPIEILGPPGLYDEGVGFSTDQESIIVTAEGTAAPLYRLELSRSISGNQ